MDFAKARAEQVQAALRMVRSCEPAAAVAHGDIKPKVQREGRRQRPPFGRSKRVEENRTSRNKPGKNRIRRRAKSHLRI